MNGFNGPQPLSNGSARKSQTPTVDEALQYSPICSVVPFNPDILPIPSAIPPSSSQIFGSQDERRAAHRNLNALNAEATNAHTTSVRLQRTLQDLRNLLQHDGLTQYNFKLPIRLPQTSAKLPPPPSLNLSPFSKMVLNNTSVPYRYPTPSSVSSEPSNSKPNNKPTATEPKPEPKRAPPPKVAKIKTEVNQTNEINGASVQQNAQIPMPSLPQKSPQDTRAGPNVIISSLSSNRKEYKSFPEIDARIATDGTAVSKKRKHDEYAGENEILSASVDQRSKANSTVDELNNLLNDIVDAEDRYQPDTSGLVSTDASSYFLSGHVPDSDALILAPMVQSRLDTAIHRVIQVDRFSYVPVDLLNRAQKLCDTAVSSVDALSLTVGEGWAESDIEEWSSRLEAAGNGLQAGKTLLRIMNAGREEKQLYSEELLQSVLTSVKHVLETCIVPVVEARSSGDSSEAFKIYSAHKKLLTSLIQVCGRVLRFLGDLIVKIDVTEGAVTSMEFLSTRLIFVENAHTEKDSTLGIRRFESMRRIAMDALAKIFARYADQRTFIFDEILTSLEKLPVTRQSARQFKMEDGRPIQLVSALLMQLIQMSATRPVNDREKLGSSSELLKGHTDDESDSEDPRSKRSRSPNGGPDRFGNRSTPADLKGVAEPLHEAAWKNTRYVVSFMVNRALTATKSGDQPYRNLLDIFIEDFIAVLGQPDWPAAETFLQVLLWQMFALFNEKTPVPAKNMALDLMGLMGSGISDLRTHVGQMLRSLDKSESNLAAQLVQRGDDILEDRYNPSDVLEFEGPYRVVLEFLQAEGKDDQRLQSALGLHLALWAKSVWGDTTANHEGDGTPLSDHLASNIRHMILDPSWLGREYEFESVSKPQGRLASSLIVLSMPFCKAFASILNCLLTSLSSEHASLKSRGLKSVVQLLEKDASILERSNLVLNHIIRCMNDASSLVRDSALGLVGKCLTIKPSLETVLYDKIIVRTNDPAAIVRKRAIKLLKEIHLRNETKDIRSAIASALLQRVQDQDDSVAELSRQTIEEIWLNPLHISESAKIDPLKKKLSLRHQVALIVQTVQRGDAVLPKLDALLRSVMGKSSKQAEANSEACKLMVSTLFEGVIDNEELPGAPAQRYVLETLTVFAKANPRLFTVEQLELLQPYVQNLSTEDDLHVYRSAIVIFRHCFPVLTSYRHEFLKAVQNSMLTTCSKLPKQQLDEVAQCLWIIDGVLKNTDRLVRLTASVVVGMLNAKDKELDDKALPRLKKYMMIGGYFGKACNLDNHLASFKEKVPWWKGTSVATLIVDMICPFTRQKFPMDLREQAFESIGVISQSWPKQFERVDVRTAFELAFHNRESRLERIVLSSFKDFFAIEERKSESGAEIAVGEGAVHGAERLGISLVASESDGISTSIAQRYIPHIIRISLGAPDDLALLATEIIASINRQGLQHPKECGPALIALETSSNLRIAEIAFKEHRNLHQKHETMFEKEYMKAVTQAFEYQKDVLKSTEGATLQPFAPKLRMLFEVLKAGNSKARKRFLTNLCSRSKFEPTKLDSWTKESPFPYHVLLSRFCLQNLAFFDYPRVEEIIHVVSCLEKIVTTTGTPIAHSIETQIMKVCINSERNGLETPGIPPPESNFVDLSNPQLRPLAIATLVLTMVWETRSYLRRLWGLQKQKDGKSKVNVKDLNKAPTKAPAVTGDKYWERINELMNCLRDPNTMVAQCRSFVELLSVDNELKVAPEEDDDADIAVAAATGYETPSEDEGTGPDGTPGSGNRSKKRRLSVPSVGGVTPKKRKGRPNKPKGIISNDRSNSIASRDDEEMPGINLY